MRGFIMKAAPGMMPQHVWGFLHSAEILHVCNKVKELAVFMTEVAEAQTFCKSSVFSDIRIPSFIWLYLHHLPKHLHHGSLTVLIFRCCGCQVVFQISRNCSRSHVRAHLHMNVTFFSCVVWRQHCFHGYICESCVVCFGTVETLVRT